MLRVLLLLATNFAVLMLATVTLNLLGVGPWLNANGIDFGSLLVFGAVLGFGGAFFSLAISKWIAKRTMGVEVIATPRNDTEAWLVETVRRLAAAAGIGNPEVGIFDSPEPNAFATGASRNHALVAVSTGLLARMSRAQAEAVMGHEVTHVANGDMVTLTLIQGVVNTFVFVLARVIGNLVDRLVFRNEEGRGPAFWITTMIAQLLLSLVAMMIVMWFSRRREFRADQGRRPRHRLQAPVPEPPAARGAHRSVEPGRLSRPGPFSRCRQSGERAQLDGVADVVTSAAADTRDTAHAEDRLVRLVDLELEVRQQLVSRLRRIGLERAHRAEQLQVLEIEALVLPQVLLELRVRDQCAADMGRAQVAARAQDERAVLGDDRLAVRPRAVEKCDDPAPAGASHRIVAQVLEQRLAMDQPQRHRSQRRHLPTGPAMIGDIVHVAGMRRLP
jgi:heat shock protein HtpX